MTEANEPTFRPLPVTAEVCPATRHDGTPCWMRTHPGNTHMTVGFEPFRVPQAQMRNADLTRHDPLRDAPHALRPTAPGQNTDS